MARRVLAAEWTRRVSASCTACPVNLAKERIAAMEKEKMQSTQIKVEAQRVNTVTLASTADAKDVVAEVVTPSEEKK